MKTSIRIVISSCLAAAMLCGLTAFAAFVGISPRATAADADHTCTTGEMTIEDVAEPTCAAEGSYNEVFRCTICNKILSSTPVTVPKTTAHIWDAGVVTKRVTRTAPGEIFYSCTVDGCTATKTVMVPVNPFLRGDVDADGRITAEDARLVLRFSVGMGPEDGVISAKQTDESYQAADYDETGAVDSADARLILRASVGLPA